MTDTLRLFTTESLFAASSALLDRMGIAFDRETAQPISVADFYDTEMPKYLAGALTHIKATYFIGIANDDSLRGEKNEVSLEDVKAETEREGRYDGMMIFACDAERGAEMTRSDIAALTRGFNRISSYRPVIVIIRQGRYISISTCERMEYSQEWRNNEGEKIGKVNILRNINCEKPHRGHLNILKGLEEKYDTFEKLYNKWMKVFNTELLTKAFYNDLFQWYQWAVNPDSRITFPGNADTPLDDREDIDTRVIRLITRLMFVWFIKQKELVPDKIFDVDYLKTILKEFDSQSTTQSNYYQAILQNLFFATLNRPILEDGDTRRFATNNDEKEVTNLYRYGSTDKDGGLFSISNDEVIELFSRVPFLNCGLFECLDKNKRMDGVKRRYYNDGFSRNPAKFENGTYRYRAVVPNIFFFHKEKGLISIFERYEFTIMENTPQEVQVALDPELLGKVFENLLGAYNPETQKTARNQSGSFYTPREIVQYMVNESLVAHLKSTVGEGMEEEYRKLLSFTNEECCLTEEQRERIIHSLFTCKVLDPACGSGAFPMGMLQQMVHLLRQVDPENTQWRNHLENLAADDSRKAFGIVDEEERNAKLNEIRETFNNALNSPDYTRKLYIIESCIYGSDIQPIAMLITRLRFFITLICEQTEIKWDKPEENFGIKTLPNLESKFVAANSLMDADIHKYSQSLKYDKELTKKKDELLAVRHKHFYTHKRNEKISLREEDERIRGELHTLISSSVTGPDLKKIEDLERRIAECQSELPVYETEAWVEEVEQTDLFGESETVRIDKNKQKRESLQNAIKECNAEIKRENNKKTPPGFENSVLQITDWNPYDQNKVSPFLDLEWMFGMSEGFDIVIGNPPYIQLQDNKGKLAKLYETCGFETFDNMGDIYCLFYERGNKLLKEKGLLCYITSNSWMRNGYGEKLRFYLSSSANPKLLINFKALQIFDTATVETNILLSSNEANAAKTFCAQISRISDICNDVNENGCFASFSDSNAWVVLSKGEYQIRHKIQINGTIIKKLGVSILYGVKTGFNDAFVITTEQREEILSRCRSKEEKLRTAELIVPTIRGRDIKHYSYQWANLWLINTHNGLKQEDVNPVDINDYPAIKEHLDKYWDDISKRGDKGVTPYNLRNCAYLRELTQPKIIWIELSDLPKFTYSVNEIPLNTVFFMSGNNLHFLLGCLNSKPIYWYFTKMLGCTSGMGTNRWLKFTMEQLPMPNATEEQQKPIIDLVDRILMAKQSNPHADTSSLESEIDQLVYKLYELTPEEISIVENSTK